MSTTSMRAARIVAQRRVEIEDVPLPIPAAGEVRFRVNGCGVCGSNLGPWLGLPWTRYPLGPGESGHEAWGVIDALGSGVKGLRAGARIAAISYNAYAEYDVAPASAVVQLPAELDGLPFPGEALGCAYNVFRRCAVERGQAVAVVGIGFIGSILTRLASRAGARVIAVSRRPFSLDVARRMGADDLVSMQDHRAVIDTVNMLTDGQLCDTVVECVGQQWPLDLAAELTKTRGRLVIAGYHQDGARQVNMQLWNWRGMDVINAHERAEPAYVRGMRDAVERVMTGDLDPLPLYTHRFGLEQLGDALNATLERPEGFLKAWVEP